MITVPGYQIIWTARDGAEAIAKCEVDTPDLILMELIMPIMDGVQATQQIMQQSPCAILLMTENLQQNAAKVFEAMGAGALDTVSGPLPRWSRNLATAQPLLQKIAAIRTLLDKPPQKAALLPQASRSCLAPLWLIGASTGGPKALATVLSKLPHHLKSPIVVVQHLDAQFAQGIMEWLQLHTALPIVLAHAGDRLHAGTVYLSSQNDHLILNADLCLGYVREPVDYPYRPSIDVFFKSVAQVWKQPGTAVLLTGMGRDGSEGLLILRQQGWQTIAQNQATCAVYGMPKAAVELGAATEILPLNAIAEAMLRSAQPRPLSPPNQCKLLGSF